MAACVRNYNVLVIPGTRIIPVNVIVYEHEAGVYYWYVRELGGATRMMTGDECDQIVLECSLDPMLKMSSLVCRYRASNV